MSSENKLANVERVFSRPGVFYIRGWFMLLIGSLLIIMTLLQPNVMILSQNYSWLPFVAILLILIGGLRCLDGILSPRSPRFLVNLQGGILDSVVGFLILFSTSGEPVLLAYLVSGYLLTQGIIRLILSFIFIKDNPWSTGFGGLMSLILGFLVCMQWPSTGAWFLSMALSVEITTRGWALVQLGKSLSMQTD